MTDLVRKIADAMEKLAWEIPAPNQWTPRLIEIAQAARRAALADAGGAVGFIRDDFDGYVRCVWHNGIPPAGTNLYAHPDSGRVAELEAELQERLRTNCATLKQRNDALERIAALEQQLAASREREERLREILLAVESSEFEGDYCNDVNGVNWFDARDAALAADKEKK